MERDDFLDRLRGRLADELSAVADPRVTHQWVISEDDNGLAVADVTGTDRADHELLASLVDTGAFAAAFVNHVPGPPEQVYVQVLVTRPFRTLTSGRLPCSAMRADVRSSERGSTASHRRSLLAALLHHHAA
jgi:hypothetical protein